MVAFWDFFRRDKQGPAVKAAPITIAQEPPMDACRVVSARTSGGERRLLLALVGNYFTLARKGKKQSKEEPLNSPAPRLSIDIFEPPFLRFTEEALEKVSLDMGRYGDSGSTTFNIATATVPPLVTVPAQNQTNFDDCSSSTPTSWTAITTPTDSGGDTNMQFAAVQFASVQFANEQLANQEFINEQLANEELDNGDHAKDQLATEYFVQEELVAGSFIQEEFAAPENLGTERFAEDYNDDQSSHYSHDDGSYNSERLLRLPAPTPVRPPRSPSRPVTPSTPFPQDTQ